MSKLLPMGRLLLGGLELQSVTATMPQYNGQHMLLRQGHTCPAASSSQVQAVPLCAAGTV